MALDRLTDVRAQDAGTIVRELNIRLRQLNRLVGEVETLQNTIQGINDASPKFSNDVDLQNHRMLNALRSKGPDQYVTRRELQELGIYNPNPARLLEVDNLNVKNKLTVGGATVVTTTTVLNLLTQIIGAEVATIRDGDDIDLEDSGGTSGLTSGTLLFGLGPGGKARPIHVNAGGAIVQEDPRTVELLELLLEAIERLNSNFGEDE